MRYLQNKWIATNYTYYKTENIIDSLNLLSKVVSNDKAALIQNFLIQDSILNLPTQIAIPNFTDNTADGETTYIEIATSKFYKQISYHNPQYFNEPNNKQFLNFLNKIKIYY